MLKYAKYAAAGVAILAGILVAMVIMMSILSVSVKIVMWVGLMQ